MKVNYKNEALKTAVSICLRNNLRVFRFQDKNIGQVFVGDEKGVCSISADFGGINLTSVHKPNRRCGTGYRLTEDSLYTVNIEEIKSAMKCFAPAWAWNNDLKHIKKYKGINDYISKQTVLTYTEIKRGDI